MEAIKTILEPGIVLAGLFVSYMLPTYVAVFRGHHQRMAICALNLLLGWTILGWIAALVWSLTATREPHRDWREIATGKQKKAALSPFSRRTSPHINHETENRPAPAVNPADKPDSL